MEESDINTKKIEKEIIKKWGKCQKCGKDEWLTGVIPEGLEDAEIEEEMESLMWLCLACREEELSKRSHMKCLGDFKEFSEKSFICKKCDEKKHCEKMVKLTLKFK